MNKDNSTTGTAGAAPDARALPSSMAGQFSRGLAYPLRALPFISKNKLWGPCVWPIMIDIGLFFALVILTLVFADDLRGLLWARPEAGGLTGAVKVGLWHALRLMLTVVLLALDLVLFVVLGTAIAGPFLDILGERTERILGAELPQTVGVKAFARSVAFSISDTVVILAFYIAVSVSLLAVNLVPVLGTVAYIVLSTCLAWLLAALEFLGLPLNRRLTPFMVKWQTVWRNRWTSLGFGCAVLVLLFVPILNLALLPLAAVGGTMFYLDLAAAGRLPGGVPGSGAAKQAGG